MKVPVADPPRDYVRDEVVVGEDELEGSTSSAILSATFEKNLLRDTLLFFSPVSRSALPKVQLKENSEKLLVLVEGSEWLLMFLLHSPVCLMTKVAHEDKLQSEGGLVASEVEGPAERLADVGEGDEKEMLCRLYLPRYCWELLGNPWPMLSEPAG